MGYISFTLHSTSKTGMPHLKKVPKLFVSIQNNIKQSMFFAIQKMKFEVKTYQKSIDFRWLLPQENMSHKLNI